MKNKIKNSIPYFSVLFLFVLALACKKDYNYEPPKPPQAGQTNTLEASPTLIAPKDVNHSYWNTANYYKVVAENMSTGTLYTDGWLNMTGTFDGLSDFNEGNNPNLVLKAAYDQENLYILAEWRDTTVNLSQGSWLFFGPSDPKKGDNADNWTSQRNADHIAFAFDVDGNASGAAGTFASVGCQASCHGTGPSANMQPLAGKVDIWDWNMATSVPMNYVHDKISTASGFSDDAGTPVAVRNAKILSDPSRSGPAYESDSSNQYYTNPFGQKVLLNKAFYILNKTDMVGNAADGRAIFEDPDKCFSCHGAGGTGGSDDLPVNGIAQNKKSRLALMTRMDNVPDMTPYWSPLSASQKDDVIAYLRGLSGVPGYYLQVPSGSCSDITTMSNITPINIDNAMDEDKNRHGTYKVLIIRKLKTNNADDVQFDLTKSREYKFGVALMDNDGKNHIGSKVITLTFK
jgi:mono/diheme cytochrome c family protein